MAERKHVCLCCGFYTLSESPPGTWLTCPVCYWIDSPVENAATQNDLFDAQRSFLRMGASSPAWSESVRAPLASEARSSDWQPMEGVIDGVSQRDKARTATEAVIVAAFSGVSPAGRKSLRDAYRTDYHGGEPDIDWRDQDTTWQNIPDDVLEYFDSSTSVFIFGNVESFRYYLPAYMLYGLRTGRTSKAVSALDLKVPKGSAPQELREVMFLDQAQRHAIVGFLRFVIDHHGPDKIAERAFERVWRHVAVEDDEL
jgi:hypothetical protein